jgi:hypothetical protein
LCRATHSSQSLLGERKKAVNQQEGKTPSNQT